MNYYNGAQFYDDNEIFNRYWERRKNEDHANNVIETPIIQHLVGNVEGLEILELGCGDGSYGLEHLMNNCKHYIGVDGSRNMYELATKNLKDFKNSEIILSRLEECDFQEQHFDLVISRLTLHYVENLKDLIANINTSLKDQGRLIISVEHPIMTSNKEVVPIPSAQNEINVKNYFHTGERRVNWLGGNVIKYHRTIEQYYEILRKCGFEIESIKEATPEKINFSSVSNYEQKRSFPLFLILAATKRKTLEKR
ncbi:class I SAM-dependent methyltransferase [Bacillus sp. FJAT-47783]|uniref:class I SAM-dependent methyltransferase n=1 Tax=Bacillus sp. FJAT-47783 TaxID=2922712 RepID=UPI001FAB38F7|nr:class I SAM-dependent methyltransferase [Bacillus sp. FJAT-47783]